MFQSAGFLGSGKSCVIFLNYKLMTHTAASPDVKLAQQIGFVKSKRTGKAKPIPRRDNLCVFGAFDNPERRGRGT